MLGKLARASFHTIRSGKFYWNSVCFEFFNLMRCVATSGLGSIALAMTDVLVCFAMDLHLPEVLHFWQVFLGCSFSAVFLGCSFRFSL